MEFQDRCPNCGEPRQEGAAFCGNCGKPFTEPKPEEPQSAPPPPVPEPGMQSEEAEERKYVAWEDRENMGFFGGIWDTWKESVFGPDGFFGKLPYRGGIGNPLLYALIISWVAVAIQQVWSIMFSGIMYDMMADFIPREEMFMATGLQTGFSFLYLLFVAPFLIIAGLFISSGIYHLIMMIFGWSKRDFEATFRAVAYSAGPMLFYIVPMCGGLIGLVWTLVLYVFGLKHMQKTTGGNAAITVLLPIFLCCCIITGLIILFGAAITGLIKESMNGSYYYD